GRKVRSLYFLPKLRDRDVRLVDLGADRVDDLAQVVRRDVRRHANGDALRPVHQQVREPGGKHGRLLLVPVVVRDEVDGLFVDVAQELHGQGREPRLRVSRRAGGIAVDRSEVALRVDQGVAEGEVLGQADERIV